MRDRLNLAFPSLLLVLVAAVQIYRAHAYSQSSWKGGGFGMFATADSPQARFLRCVIVGEDGKEYRVRLPGRLQSAAVKARIVPTEENVRDLAEDALRLDWVREDYLAVEPLESPDDTGGGVAGGEAQPGSGPGRIDPSSLTYRALGKSEPRPPKELMLRVKKVRVEVWRSRLDPASMKVEAVMLRSGAAEE